MLWVVSWYSTCMNSLHLHGNSIMNIKIFICKGKNLSIDLKVGCVRQSILLMSILCCFSVKANTWICEVYYNLANVCRHMLFQSIAFSNPTLLVLLWTLGHPIGQRVSLPLKLMQCYSVSHQVSRALPSCWPG